MWRWLNCNQLSEGIKTGHQREGEKREREGGREKERERRRGRKGERVVTD